MPLRDSAGGFISLNVVEAHSDRVKPDQNITAGFFEELEIKQVPVKIEGFL
jgi:hypothetical protein